MPLCLSIAPLLWAQEDTLREDVDFISIGNPTAKVTAINGRFALLLGGGAAGLIGQNFVVGLGAYRLVNSIPVEQTPAVCNADAKDGDIAMWYGGIELGYVYETEEAARIEIGFLFGGGQAAARYRQNWYDVVLQKEACLIFEPGIELDADISDDVAIGLGIGYRFAGNPNDSPCFLWDNLSGPSISLSLIVIPFRSDREEPSPGDFDWPPRK